MYLNSLIIVKGKQLIAEEKEAVICPSFLGLGVALQKVGSSLAWLVLLWHAASQDPWALQPAPASTNFARDIFGEQVVWGWLDEMRLQCFESECFSEANTQGAGCKQRASIGCHLGPISYKSQQTLP